MMMKNACLILGLLIANCSALASAPITLKARSETWGDDAMEHLVAITVMGPAEDEQKVRAQMAGIFDTSFGRSVMLSVSKVTFDKFSGYPAFFADGVSLANSMRRNCRVLMIFTTSHTYAVHCFAPEGEKLPSPEKYIQLEGEPSKVTEAAFAWLRPRLEKELSQIRENVEKSAAALTKPKRQPEGAGP